MSSWMLSSETCKDMIRLKINEVVTVHRNNTRWLWLWLWWFRNSRLLPTRNSTILPPNLPPALLLLRLILLALSRWSASPRPTSAARHTSGYGSRSWSGEELHAGQADCEAAVDGSEDAHGDEGHADEGGRIQDQPETCSRGESLVGVES